ncbi:MAG: GIY-YIG nuclease family protein [Candidatus Doudnabacteria bacterium]
MFFVYVLKSLKDLELYISSTKDLKERYKKHSLGLVFSTKLRRPLKLVYYEAFSNEEEARHREHNLKLRGRARKQLLNRIKKSIDS